MTKIAFQLQTNPLIVIPFTAIFALAFANAVLIISFS